MYRKGVIKCIKEDFNMDTLKWKGVSDLAPIYKVKRIFKTMKEGTELKKIATRNIIITFEGDILPETIYLYGVAPTRVHMYIPKVRICYNCFAFGHTTAFCKKERKCINCGNLFHTQNIQEKCTMDTKCCNCQEDHLPNSDKCHIQVNREINRVGARDNISSYEAKIKYSLYPKNKNTRINLAQPKRLAEHYNKHLPQTISKGTVHISEDETPNVEGNHAAIAAASSSNLFKLNPRRHNSMNQNTDNDNLSQIY